jgi:hypothetical protein
MFSKPKSTCIVNVRVCNVENPQFANNKKYIEYYINSRITEQRFFVFSNVPTKTKYVFLVMFAFIELSIEKPKQVSNDAFALLRGVQQGLFKNATFPGVTIQGLLDIFSILNENGSSVWKSISLTKQFADYLLAQSEMIANEFTYESEGAIVNYLSQLLASDINVCNMKSKFIRKIDKPITIDLMNDHGELSIIYVAWTAQLLPQSNCLSILGKDKHSNIEATNDKDKQIRNLQEEIATLHQREAEHEKQAKSLTSEVNDLRKKVSDQEKVIKDLFETINSLQSKKDTPNKSGPANTKDACDPKSHLQNKKYLKQYLMLTQNKINELENFSAKVQMYYMQNNDMGTYYTICKLPYSKPVNVACVVYTTVCSTCGEFKPCYKFTDCTCKYCINCLKLIAYITFTCPKCSKDFTYEDILQIKAIIPMQDGI